MFFSQNEYEQRWHSVYDEMKARGYDIAVIWGRSGGNHERCGDVLYLTNFYSTVSGQSTSRPNVFSAVLFCNREVPRLFIGEPDTALDLLATDRVEAHFNPMQLLAGYLNRQKIEGRVALVGTDFLPIKYWRPLEEATPGISWIPEDDLVRKLRRIKGPREIECFRRAGDTVSAGLNALIEGLVGGKSEAEAAAAAAYEVIRRGGSPHMIPCSHGDRINYFCRYPLTGYSQDAPRSGDLVRGWIYGPMFEGYWLDPGRTAVAGRRPTLGQRLLIESAAKIIDRLIEAIRPGVRVVEIAKLGDQLVAEAGGERDQAARMFPLYGHSLGHFFEPPIITTDPGFPDQSAEQFQANMVLGVEVFIGAPGVGSAGFEQNIIIGIDRNELLTTTPMISW